MDANAPTQQKSELPDLIITCKCAARHNQQMKAHTTGSAASVRLSAWWLNPIIKFAQIMRNSKNKAVIPADDEQRKGPLHIAVLHNVPCRRDQCTQLQLGSIGQHTGTDTQRQRFISLESVWALATFSSLNPLSSVCLSVCVPFRDDPGLSY